MKVCKHIFEIVLSPVLTRRCGFADCRKFGFAEHSEVAIADDHAWADLAGGMAIQLFAKAASRKLYCIGRLHWSVVMLETGCSRKIAQQSRRTLSKLSST